MARSINVQPMIFTTAMTGWRFIGGRHHGERNRDKRCGKPDPAGGDGRWPAARYAEGAGRGRLALQTDERAKNGEERDEVRDAALVQLRGGRSGKADCAADGQHRKKAPSRRNVYQQDELSPQHKDALFAGDKEQLRGAR
jgi:hypothetical protein